MTTPTTPTVARRRRAAQRGNVALIVALMVVMLCGFAALAVDVGQVYRVAAQTRAALDAAALAAAGSLNGTTDGLTNARSAAQETAKAHRVYGADLQLVDSEIVFGNWNMTTNVFTPNRPLIETNAVQIKHTTPAVTNPFGGILGVPTSRVGRTATAVGGGPINAPCTFPFVVAACAVQPAITADGNCNYCLVFQGANGDTAGFTAFSDNVSGGTIYNWIVTACTDGGNPMVDANGYCKANCNKVDVNATLNLGNGNLMNQGNGQANPCRELQDIVSRDNRNGKGTNKPFKVTVPVIGRGDDQPCNPSFSNTGTATGFAELTIYGAKCGNADKTGVFASLPSGVTCAAPTSDKYITATLECRSRLDVPGGGSFFGLQARPRLVPDSP